MNGLLRHDFYFAVALDQALNVLDHVVLEVLHVGEQAVSLVIVGNLRVLVVHLELGLQMMRAERLETVSLGRFNVVLRVRFFEFLANVLNEHERQLFVHLLVCHAHDQKSGRIDVMEVEVVELE